MNYSAQSLFDEAFQCYRAPRSMAYKEGVLAILRLRIDHSPLLMCPYDLGTSEADAYFAGTDEGHAIATKKLDVGLRPPRSSGQGK